MIIFYKYKDFFLIYPKGFSQKQYCKRKRKGGSYKSE